MLAVDWPKQKNNEKLEAMLLFSLFLRKENKRFVSVGLPNLEFSSLFQDPDKQMAFVELSVSNCSSQFLVRHVAVIHRLHQLCRLCADPNSRIGRHRKIYFEIKKCLQFFLRHHVSGRGLTHTLCGPTYRGGTRDRGGSLQILLVRSEGHAGFSRIATALIQLALSVLSM